MTAPICAGTYGTDPKAEYSAVRGVICNVEIGDDVAGFVRASTDGGYKAFSPSTGWEIGDFKKYDEAFRAALAANN